MGGANLQDSVSRFEKGHHVTLRFYEELNDFLPPERRKQSFTVAFELPRSVKDLIESLGVPHVEIDLILVNGTSVDFDHIVRNDDRVSVYPMFESIDITDINRLRPSPLRIPRFILDVHLAALARKLRMLGFDTLYSNTLADDELAEISSGEQRILLTRDLGLLKRSQVARGLFVRATDPREQIIEIMDRLDLYERITPFSRCIRCNGIIRVLSSEERASLAGEIDNRNGDAIPESVLKWCETFHRCTSCGRYYWKGSHFSRMLEEIEEIRSRRK